MYTSHFPVYISSNRRYRLDNKITDPFFTTIFRVDFGLIAFMKST